MKSTVLRICRDNIIIIKFGGNNLILACFVQETISIIFDGDQVPGTDVTAFTYEYKSETNGQSNESNNRLERTLVFPTSVLVHTAR
jgi:hypothetical protein